VDAGDGSVCDFLVAGHITFGETPYQTAVREWKEEMLTPLPNLEYYGILHPPVSIAKAYVFVVRTENFNFKCIPSRGYVRSLVSTDVCRNDFYAGLRALNRYFPLPKNFNMDMFCSRHYDQFARYKIKEQFLEKYGNSLGYQRKMKTREAAVMWNSIYNDHKKKYMKQCRVHAEDLKMKFNVSLRSTNQAAIVHSQLQINELVIFNSDSNTPCPFINLIFDGRAIGYAIYIRTFQSKCIYRVQQVIPNYYSVENDKNRVNYSPLMLLRAKESGVARYVNGVTESTILGHVEFTDSDLGAQKLAQHKGITFDEAVILIREFGYIGVNL